MSTFFADIQGALRAQLNTLPNKPPIAWENVDYNPNSGTLFLRATGLPGETVQLCLGDNGLDDHIGIFQVDVFIPDGKGRSTWPDQIADHFKRGTILTLNEVDVRITSVSIEAADKDENFFIVPVSISYRVQTQARTA
jgi:hypothetical protein